MSDKKPDSKIPLDSNMPRDQGKESTSDRRHNGSNEKLDQVQGDKGKTIKPESQRRQ